MAFVGLAITGGGALAHSWYPAECCSRVDCHPLPPGAVRATPEGWRLEDGTLVPYAKARRSQDGQFHACRDDQGRGNLIREKSGTDCFFAPEGGA